MKTVWIATLPCFGYKIRAVSSTRKQAESLVVKEFRKQRAACAKHGLQKDFPRASSYTRLQEYFGGTCEECTLESVTFS